MKFEHVLQIYWLKGFFFSGKLFYFNLTLESFFSKLPGLGLAHQLNFIKRFELTFFYYSLNQDKLNNYLTRTTKKYLKAINIFLSQINNVNNQIKYLHKLNIIYSYLIKSYKGYCHALGKPVKGQRT